MKKNTSSTNRVLTNKAIPALTIGIDLGDKKHAICVLDKSGEILEQRAITNHRDSLRRFSVKYPVARMIIEVGSHSPWMVWIWSSGDGHWRPKRKIGDVLGNCSFTGDGKTALYVFVFGEVCGWRALNLGGCAGHRAETDMLLQVPTDYL